MSDNAATTKALTTVEDEQRLLERERIKSERKKLRLARRIDIVRDMVVGVKLTAARQVDLKKYVFETDEALRAKGLSDKQIRIVRGWEVEKRNAPYALESSSKLLEAETRAQTETKGPTLNVETLIVRLPEKSSASLPEPIVIEAEVSK